MNRFWANLLLCDFLLLGLALFPGVFSAIQSLSSSTWHARLRRLIRAMGQSFPVAAALTAILLFGVQTLHPAVDSPAKLFWFILRAATYLSAWHVATRLLRHQDEGAKRPAAVFLIIFSLTFTAASVDWLMSLTPRWASTLFPWYVFSGVFVGGFAAVAVLLVLGRRRGFFTDVGESELHDLGKYLFAFSFFWGYLWFSQYMLIWYSNLPEETAFYAAQMRGFWRFLFWSNPIVNLVVPFVLLLSASAKRSERTLLAAGLLILAGRWLDLYLIIMPPVLGNAPVFSWIEPAVALGVAGLFLCSVAAAFNRVPSAR